MSWFVFVESNTTGSGRRFCRVASDLGLRPLVLARDPHRYAFTAVDGVDVSPVDTGDLGAVLRHCADLPGRIEGIWSSSEYGVAVAAAAGRALGLPGPSPDAVAACRDKVRQRAVLAAAGVPAPRWHVARTASDAVRAARALGFPVVVKPPRESGSLGVRLCRDRPEVVAGFTAACHRGSTLDTEVLVEEYVDGDEYSVEVFDGKAVGVTRKYLGAAPHFVETGHDFPADVSAPDEAELVRVAEASAEALDLGWGPIHVEVRLTTSGASLIEVNPRLAGGMIPDLVLAASGVDLVDRTVRRAVGADPVTRPAPGARASIRFVLAPRAGVVAGVSGLGEAERMPGVRAVHASARPGDPVVITHSFRDRLGYAIATGDTAAAAADRADAAARRIRVEIG
ncbi:ATP-grasp domain-containing protein [Actinosynnema sp. NPDC020468]|uniref:ATP-grasp domain-containing protein n=1 Tax=Actinosynnema sp. NPDC020468 TaxID=3154488 RepID=UPI0033EA3722